MSVSAARTKPMRQIINHYLVRVYIFLRLAQYLVNNNVIHQIVYAFQTGPI
ncbi:hypothetical protein BJX63DRAFT_135469 [Aspergillus granulosus]|uniref:Uncharacterized protein n=1 Tax=Aspergillus granulosus TaxID=176169 RepID=A0ABR4HPV2_9EURO